MTAEMLKKGGTTAARRERRLRELEKEGRFIRPLVDIVETKDNYLIYVDMPGVKKEDITIQLEAEDLVLNGVVSRDYWKEGKLLCNECFYTRYHRDFVVGYDIDRSKIQAEFNNGVLTIKLQKQEEAKPREIQIN